MRPYPCPPEGQEFSDYLFCSRCHHVTLHLTIFLVISYHSPTSHLYRPPYLTLPGVTLPLH